MNAAILAFPASPVVITNMVSATALCAQAHTDERNVFVTMRLVGKTETWVRLPERRKNVCHLRMQCEHLNDVAEQLSLPQFRRYLADCGFVVQS